MGGPYRLDDGGVPSTLNRPRQHQYHYHKYQDEVGQDDDGTEDSLRAWDGS